ncbi:MAG: T9SS type A sorting domain-containing protein [Phaeodactylibacter xiamenensis]|uniref:T9SS type A sorting domain-containing protein n=1 Tax=Phaeodactylibacter xiamenensis TaxID=1524460 RepID=UPI0012699B67|nr:T9SS type A sorting domain-containing protein [Phaeodactylibacter xiamenensis]MCR9050721.1 T9SS type A sorting domain-containing protein [bacterium]
MRLIITTFALLFFGALAHAQITIERQDFTLEAGMQTKAWYLDHTGASVPEIGEGQVWDFSGLSLDGSFTADYEEPSSPLFPQANITEPSFATLLGGLGVQTGLNYNSIDDSGYGSWGSIGEQVTVPLAPVTGMDTDNLTILELVIQYNQRRDILKFPLNYGESWTHSETYNIDFLVTVAGFGLQNVPAGQTIQDSVSYEVAGYGTVILPNPEGPDQEPVSIEGLLIKRDRVTVNNYTLGGQPAPQLMLDAFGLTQGESQVTTRYFIYAKGLPRTAANIGVDANGEITSFTISDDITQLISSTSEPTAEPLQAKAFPNPIVAGEALSVELPTTIQNGALELVDALGRQVAIWPVSGLQGQIVSCNLPAHLQAGLYVYRIMENNQEVRGIGKLNVIR